MKKKVLLSLLIAVILVQIAVPAFFALDRYDVLRQGAEYKFRVSAYAVGDKISFSITDIDWATVPENARYGVISVGEDGFASISSVEHTRPTAPYIESATDGGFTFPVKQIKLDSKAYESLFHKIYEYGSEIYIKVRVRNGKVVLENMYVDNKTIQEYLKNN